MLANILKALKILYKRFFNNFYNQTHKFRDKNGHRTLFIKADYSDQNRHYTQILKIKTWKSKKVKYRLNNQSL